MTSREQPRQERSPQTSLGQRLAEIRERIKASGQPLLSWEDIDRELADRRGEREPIEEAIERIVAGFDPLRILLFGSLARGESGPNSDVDLLVVMPDGSFSDKHQITVEILRALKDMPFPKDIVVTTPEEIERRGDLVGTVLRPALREGKILYERA